MTSYPGQDFQSGLFRTWMFAGYAGPKPEEAYSDIEGGLGWWPKQKNDADVTWDTRGK